MTLAIWCQIQIKKNWANEYVDFGTLLPNGDVKSQGLPIVVNGIGNEKKLALQENSKQIKTLDQWISAFSVYMTIYCKKKLRKQQTI
jgi:hypothetical protein